MEQAGSSQALEGVGRYTGAQLSLEMCLIGDVGIDREHDEVVGAREVKAHVGVQALRGAREKLEARCVVVGHAPLLLEQGGGINELRIVATGVEDSVDAQLGRVPEVEADAVLAWVFEHL